MGPLFHFFSTFAVVMGAAFALNIPLTVPVLVLALFGGLIPDFTHHTSEFLIFAGIAFLTLFSFGLDNRMDESSAFILGEAAVGVLLFIRSRSFTPSEYRTHKRHEFKKEWWSRTKLTYSWGYVAAFSLAALWVTGSLDIAFLAFLAYGSHAFVDWLTYGTDFGIRNMVRWSDI